jgi:hypothetical protein
MIPGSGGRRIKGLRHATRKFLISVAQQIGHMNDFDLKEFLKEQASAEGFPYDGDLIAEVLAIVRRGK